MKSDKKLTREYAALPRKQLEKQCEGLTSRQVEAQRLTYGTNQVPNVKEDTLKYRIRRAFVNPFSLVLLVLACISLLVDVLFQRRRKETSPPL